MHRFTNNLDHVAHWRKNLRFLIEPRTNVKVSEWMPSFRGYIYWGPFLVFFSPFFPKCVTVTANFCWLWFPTDLHRRIYTRMRNGWPRVERSLDSSVCPVQLDLNLLLVFNPLRDLLGYSEFFPIDFHPLPPPPPRPFSTTCFTQSLLPRVAFFFSLSVADIPTYCPEIESFTGR